jgi:hypothetical protein
MAGLLQAKKAICPLVMGSFWLGDKFWIRAETVSSFSNCSPVCENRREPREWYCEAYLKFKVLAEIAWVKLKATAE